MNPNTDTGTRKLRRPPVRLAGAAAVQGWSSDQAATHRSSYLHSRVRGVSKYRRTRTSMSILTAVNRFGPKNPLPVPAGSVAWRLGAREEIHFGGTEPAPERSDCCRTQRVGTLRGSPGAVT